MKLLVFMFPAKEFFDKEVGWRSERFKKEGYSFERLNEIIEARYRQNDWQIIWVLFKDHDSNENASVPKLISINENDLVLTADITLKEHLEKGLYPNLFFVFKGLSGKDFDWVVIGGFHYGDCVFKAFDHFNTQPGIEAFIDMEVTNRFFGLTTSYGEIPLVSRKRMLNNHQIDLIRRDPNLAELILLQGV